MAYRLGFLLLLVSAQAIASQGWRTALRARCLDLAIKEAKTISKKSNEWKPNLENPIVKEAGDKKSCDVIFNPIFKDGAQGLGGGFVIHVDTAKKASTVTYFQ
jgi:hypothetical protein